MGYKVECRLPSLNSLALDFALPQQNAPHYASYPQYPTQLQAYDPTRSPPNLESTRTLPSVVPSNVTQLKPDIFSPSKTAPLAYAAPLAAHDPFSNPNPTRLATPMMPDAAAYVANPYPVSYSSKSSLSDATPDEPAAVVTYIPTGLAYQMPPLSDSHSRDVEEAHSSDHDHSASPKSTETDSDSPEPSKKRKKRQCPQCLQHFSNLATHRSTHLNPTARPHICKVCQRGFARPNDLFRHFKCHWKEMGADHGQFKCPFKAGSSGNKCSHSSGIFSRCDTYKNHLKAIHFQYPEGTKKSNRSKLPGSCKFCSKEFKSADDWISSHIETHECSAIESESSGAGNPAP